MHRLTAANHAQIVAIAELPDMVRGYEEIKLANVAAYRAELAARLEELDEQRQLAVAG